MNATRSKSARQQGDAPPTAQQLRFRAFSRLAERAGEGRPLLRGLRVARDPKADRFVVVHAGSRVEFTLAAGPEQDAACSQVECRALDSGGKAETMPLAQFTFGDDGRISQATIPELVDEAIDQPPGAWSVVAALLWRNLNARDDAAP